MPDSVDSDTAATLALLAVAQGAAAAVEDVSSDMIEVIGSGLIAVQVRALLADRSTHAGRSTPPEQPQAVVDTTGDPRLIVDATRRVASLGTVVLVGESIGRSAELNLYPDVHLRGLTLAGVPPPLHRSAPFADYDEPLVTSSREVLVAVTADMPVPSAAWYRVSG